MNLTVIKLGGSLMQSKELPEWLDQISTYAKESSVIIVPGGGKFADDVRTLQLQQGFDDVVAHKMALLAMVQYGYYLTGLNSDIYIVDELNSIHRIQQHKKPLLWIPTLLIDDFSEIPASWDYTSDSIALWLAIKLNASNLVVVKSIKSEEADEDYLDKGFEKLIGNFAGETKYLTKLQFNDLNN